MKSFLEHFAAILGAFTVMILLMSVSHEWGYFLIVGRHFQALLTTTDYLANAVLWVPFALLMLYGAMNWDWLKERTTPRPKRDWKNWKQWIEPIIVASWVVFIFLITVWPPPLYLLYTFMVMVVWTWSRIWTGFFKPVGGLPEDLQTLHRHCIRLGPPLLVALIFIGAGTGINDVGSTSDMYSVQLKSPEQQPDDDHLRVMLRSIDKGILVRNPQTNKIEFQRWDNIVKLEKVPQRLSGPLICYFFDVLCMRAQPRDEQPQLLNRF